MSTPARVLSLAQIEAAPSLELPVRRRGRKRADPKEINKICADWLKHNPHPEP